VGQILLELSLHICTTCLAVFRRHRSGVGERTRLCSSHFRFELSFLKSSRDCNDAISAAFLSCSPPLSFAPVSHCLHAILVCGLSTGPAMDICAVLWDAQSRKMPALRLSEIYHLLTARCTDYKKNARQIAAGGGIKDQTVACLAGAVEMLFGECNKRTFEASASASPRRTASPWRCTAKASGFDPTLAINSSSW
jgi:hypothetical protein